MTPVDGHLTKGDDYVEGTNRIVGPRYTDARLMHWLRHSAEHEAAVLVAIRHISSTDTFPGGISRSTRFHERRITDGA